MKPEQLLSLLGSAVDTIAPEMPAGPASIVAQGVAAALHLVLRAQKSAQPAAAATESAWRRQARAEALR